LSDRNGQFRTQSRRAASAARSGENGFVLLIVLWWLTLLLFLGTQIAAATRTAVSISANIRGSAVAQAQAEGAVNEAIFRILIQHWKADGTKHVVRGPQAVAEVQIDDEGERIDPNVAPVALLQALAHQCGLAPKPAAELADAIYDWRSLDLRQSAETASAARYRAAGRSYLPPKTRFVSVDELGLVLGMTPELLGCLAPHLTVYALSVPSLQSTRDPIVRRAILEAYPDDPPQADAVRAISVVRVTAAARDASGGRFQCVAVVLVVPAEPDDSFVYKILSVDESPE